MIQEKYVKDIFAMFILNFKLFLLISEKIYIWFLCALNLYDMHKRKQEYKQRKNIAPTNKYFHIALKLLSCYLKINNPFKKGSAIFATHKYHVNHQPFK